MLASLTQNLSSSWAGERATRVWLPSGEHIDTKCTSVGLGIHTRYTRGHSQARPVTPRDGRVKSGGFPEEGAFSLAPVGRRGQEDGRSSGKGTAHDGHGQKHGRGVGGGWGISQEAGMGWSCAGGAGRGENPGGPQVPSPLGTMSLQPSCPGCCSGRRPARVV